MDPFAQVVPFGKYRGQDFAALVADHDYVQWLLSQNWFGERYPAIHMVIVNGGAEPQETPVHNAMQLLFLDQSLCRAVAMLYHQRFPLSWGSIVPLDILPRSCVFLEFEQRGVDVSFSIEYAWEYTAYQQQGHYCLPHGPHLTHAQWTRLDQETRERLQEEFDRTLMDRLQPYYRYYMEQGVSPHGWRITKQGGYLCAESEYLQSVEHAFPFALELKPSLGDDYPAALRQILIAMKRTQSTTHGVVICDTWSATGGTFAQVQQLFQHSRVALFRLADVQACAAMLP